MSTLIELFDSSQIENVVSCLKIRPEKVIFIGMKDEIAIEKRMAISRFLSAKGLKIEIEYAFVSDDNYQKMIAQINSLIDKNNNCCLDVTGGDELVLLAMGVICAKRNLPMFMVDVEKNELIPIENCDNLSWDDSLTASIEEMIILNGGSLIKCDTELANRSRFSDTETIWKIASLNSTEWNKNCIELCTFEKNNNYSDNALEVYVTFSRLEYNPKVNYNFLTSLSDSGIIENLSFNRQRVKYKYKNKLTKECISKAGNILEIYTYLALKELFPDKDIARSVFISWDKNPNISSTSNEIDVMIMDGFTPIFISCKNGKTEKNALYELETVADAIGGKYAKKILVSTFVSDSEIAKQQFIKRAKSMNIKLIHDFNKLPFKMFEKMLLDSIMQKF